MMRVLHTFFFCGVGCVVLEGDVIISLVSSSLNDMYCNLTYDPENLEYKYPTNLLLAGQ